MAGRRQHRRAIAYLAIGQLFEKIGNVNYLPPEIAAWSPDAKALSNRRAIAEIKLQSISSREAASGFFRLARGRTEAAG